jgi:hypothetical protein
MARLTPEGEAMRRPWTADDDAQLRKLALSGLSLTELSHKISRTASTVRARAIKLEIAIARDRNGAKKRKPSGPSSN